VGTAAEIVPEPVFADPLPVDAFAPGPDAALETTHEEPPVAEFQEWAIVAEAPLEAPPSVSVPEAQASIDPKPSLSPEAIDAIARRAIELLSDKVVREIAWEVVPELAELLIKKKLEEQK
jgi:hypothetical protein